MSAIINFQIDLKKLPKEKFVSGKNGVYLNLTMSVNDETNQYGQNASVFVNQSKEEREAKKKKEYVGNGMVVWNNSTIVNATKKDEVLQEITDDDLPF